MYPSFRALVLRLVRLPPDPEPPDGDPASLRVFRAGRRYLTLRLLRWGAAQAVALAGLVLSIVFFHDVSERADALRARRAAQGATRQAAPMGPAAGGVEGSERDNGPSDARRALSRGTGPRIRLNPRLVYQIAVMSVSGPLSALPRQVMSLIWLFEFAGVASFLIQCPITYALARLDFDMRWYMVTDRSLRIRHGVWRVRESTMSFANIQQVAVSQGPLQRALGLWDVRVQSAGGGGGGPAGRHERGEDMHLGLFHSVDDAEPIRDLILARLKHFRESGLGDPDERRGQPATPATAAPHEALVAAARELSREAKALRAAAGAGGSQG